MKAFLSHSSKDKGFVDAVTGLLRPGTFELDSLTFDKGTLNSQAILTSLRRSDLFCLFLSKNSVSAPYVDFETQIAIELLASGKLNRLLVICLDDDSFAQASANVRLINIIRKGLLPESVARLIQGHLISAADKSETYQHPFVGREDELHELERQISDYRRPVSRAIYISGNYGSGRRTIAQRFYEHQFPNVGRSFPTISLDLFAGLEELYRRILATLRPTLTIGELLTSINDFNNASEAEKRKLVAELLNSLLTSDEAAFLIDKGGVLTDSGSFTQEIDEVLSLVDAKPHPPAVFISPRMIPSRLRRDQDDISYLAVTSLKRDASERLIGRLLKNKGQTVTDDEMTELVQLSDSHPFNIYRMIDEALKIGIKSFLANPRDFIDWKHRQSSEYLAKISVTPPEASILALLKQFPELDFTAIVEALKFGEDEVSESLSNLTNRHIVEANRDIFSVAPALQIAVERDRRFRLDASTQQRAVKSLATSLSFRLGEGTAPIVLTDAAVLSLLDSEKVAEGFAGALLLPSHFLWIAKRHYDQRHWQDSILSAQKALGGGKRLSMEGQVAAYRYQCLAASRLGDHITFNEGITKLEATAKTDWARSNVAFLKGFNFRLKGTLPQAEEYLRIAYRLSPGNNSAAREIAEICLARGNLNEAERFAREAHSHGPSNPYHIDTLISVLVRKHGKSAKHMPVTCP